MPLTWVMIARVPEASLDLFARYEQAVLPGLARHGGKLERRLRSHDGTHEVHIVSFESRERFESFRLDDLREQAKHLLIASKAEVTVLEMDDVA
jgi:hypothetical protein